MGFGLVLWLLASLLSAGAPPAGIRFPPLLNALEFAQAATLALLVLLVMRTPESWQAPSRQALLALGFLTLTLATLRGVHHLGGLPWDESLIAERLSQAALSIVWTTLGIAAMVLLDAVVRLLPGVMGNALSGAEESFSSGLLEYPQYTRPAAWEGRTSALDRGCKPRRHRRGQAPADRPPVPR